MDLTLFNSLKFKLAILTAYEQGLNELLKQFAVAKLSDTKGFADTTFNGKATVEFSFSENTSSPAQVFKAPLNFIWKKNGAAYITKLEVNTKDIDPLIVKLLDLSEPYVDSFSRSSLVAKNAFNNILDDIESCIKIIKDKLLTFQDK